MHECEGIQHVVTRHTQCPTASPLQGKKAGARDDYLEALHFQSPPQQRATFEKLGENGTPAEPRRSSAPKGMRGSGCKN